MDKFFKKQKNEKQLEVIYPYGAIRTDEDMAAIDKEAADSAFKRYKKEILDNFMESNRFCKYKTGAYVRVNNIGLLEYVDIQKERYGSKTFCINFAVMPLYSDLDYLILGLGDRLGMYITGKDIWWDYSTDEIAKKSFANVVSMLEKYVFPWLLELSTLDGYKKRLKEDEKKKFIGYSPKEWLSILDMQAKEEAIKRNVEKLRLPKKILNF